MQSTTATHPGGERDHGGNLAAAVARYGGRATDWLDLSTGINPNAFPLAPLPSRAFTALPDAGRMAALLDVARQAYGAQSGGIIAAPGAQSLIEALPAFLPRRPVSIATPTYNEHAAAFRAHGFEVVEEAEPRQPIRVIVNPNNPDGRVWTRATVLAWLDEGATVIVDESFADATPETSLADLAGRPGLIILRSFGKFYGLAGLRLGFALGEADLMAQLGRALGLWAVSGPAIEAGIQGLDDDVWQATMRAQLVGEAEALADALVAARGEVIGQTHLFVTIRHQQAAALHQHLAAQHIWTRVFPYAADWLRLGLPGIDKARLDAALMAF